MNIINTVLILILSSIIPSTALADPIDIVDHWHANLQIPSSELSLIFTITKDDNGNLSATMESVDQAPGQQIPISQITLDDQNLIMNIQMIGATIDVDWSEWDEHWIGTFKQGLELPITIKRGLPENKPTIIGLDGTWKTTITRNNVDLRLILKITTNDKGTSAKVDSPDTMNMDIQVSDLSYENDEIRYTINAIKGNFVGQLVDPNTIKGTWTVPNQKTVEIIYTRSNEDEDSTKPNRPQYPEKPYLYNEEQVTFPNPLTDGVTIAGTLTLPKGEGPFPAAILISGSGPQDRDETVFGHKPFLVLAHHLTNQGIAVLRYDDRGTHESTGDYHASNSADFATDANAAMNYLHSRSEIDHDSIGFIGHSEGGLIAPLAITDPKLGANNEHPIAFLVMLAGPGTDTKTIITSQNQLIGKSQGLDDSELDQSAALNLKLIEAATSASSTEDAKSKLHEIMNDETKNEMGLTEAQAINIIAQFTTPWMRYFLTYDPSDYLSKINIPILALNGELDLQVPSKENLDGLRAILEDHPDTTIMELKKLNHMFQHAKTGALGEYADIEETFAPNAMNIISQWINERFKK